MPDLKTTLRLLAAVLLLLATAACAASTAPADIRWGQEECAHCRMNLTDKRFAAQLITTKGRAYSFDDVVCLLRFTGVEKADVAARYVASYSQPGTWIPLEKALLLHSMDIQSPMAGDIAAFATAEEARAARSHWQDQGQEVPLAELETQPAGHHGH